MANIKFTNFARSKVATGINSSATTLAITGGTGALFPALTGAEYFYLTLENSSLVREIVKVTARTADTLTIVRAQDGTTAAAWVADDVVSLRFNALAITESIGNAIQQTSAVGAALIPAGTTAERPTPAFGHQRANSTTGLMEWWNGTAWQNFATGAFAASGANNDITSLTALVGNGLLPVGSVIFHGANSAPTGYLKANGALVSRTTYAGLFAVIGTTFGVGDGSTTFALPDLRGEFIRGWDDARGIDSGRTFGTAQADDFESHTHATSAVSMPAYVGSGIADGSGGSTFHPTAAPNTATGGTETRPRNIALLACIKY